MTAAIGGMLRDVGIIGSGFNDTVIAGMLGTGDGGHPLDSFAMIGGIAAFATIKGIATFPWVVGIGRIVRIGCMGRMGGMSRMTTGITGLTATADGLVPGSGCGQATAGSGCVTGDGANNIAEFFYMLSVICQAIIPGVAHTDVQHIAPTAGVQPKRSITGGAILSLKFTDIFVETSLVGNMGAGKLQDTFTAESVL